MEPRYFTDAGHPDAADLLPLVQTADDGNFSGLCAHRERVDSLIAACEAIVCRLPLDRFLPEVPEHQPNGFSADQM